MIEINHSQSDFSTFILTTSFLLNSVYIIYLLRYIVKWKSPIFSDKI